MIVLSSADFFKANLYFPKKSRNIIECQTVRIEIRPAVKDKQQTTKIRRLS